MIDFIILIFRCKAVVYFPKQLTMKHRCYLKHSYSRGRRSNRHAHLAELPCRDLWTYCSSGRYVGSDYKTCYRCHSHTYSNGGRISSCTNCPRGTQYTGTGATRSSYCAYCPAGQYGSNAGTGCSYCSRNYYSSRTGATSCTRCPSGKITLSTGSSSSSSCYYGNANLSYKLKQIVKLR